MLESNDATFYYATRERILPNREKPYWCVIGTCRWLHLERSSTSVRSVEDVGCGKDSDSEI